MLSACDRDLEVTLAVQAALIAELRAANAQLGEANAALGLPTRLTCIRISWNIDGTVMASAALVAVACSAPVR
jgi:hypothetical protein